MYSDEKRSAMAASGNMKFGLNAILGSLLFLVLPAFFLLTGLNFNRTLYSNDPEYAYLMNGLNIARGKFVGHAENPGTTVQELSAVVLTARHLINPSEGKSLQEDVLTNPDGYIEMNRRVLIVMITIAMVFLGSLGLSITRMIWPGILLQLGIFLSADMLEQAWTKFAPEPMLIVVSSSMALMVLLSYFSNNSKSARFPFAFGLISGFGLATKVTFLPLLIIPVMVLGNKRERLTYLKWTAISALVLMIPAILEFPHMGKWFLNVFIHTGTYGEGGIGVVNPVQYITNLAAISMVNPSLVITCLFTLILSGALRFLPDYKEKHSSNPAVWYAFATGLAQLIAILMVAKHYHANHYLVPAHCLTGLAWIFNSLILTSLVNTEKVKPVLINLLLITAFLLTAFTTYPELKQANQGYKISNDEYNATLKKIKAEFPDYLKAYYYPTSINPYSALEWGNVYSRGYNLDMLSQLYPDGIFFDIRSNGFMKWESKLDADSLSAHYNGNILLVGGPLNSGDFTKVTNGGLALVPVYQGRTQAIFKVDISKSTIFR